MRMQSLCHGLLCGIAMDCRGQGCEPNMSRGSVGISVCHQSDGGFRSVFKTKPEKNETETGGLR